MKSAKILKLVFLSTYKNDIMYVERGQNGMTNEKKILKILEDNNGIITTKEIKKNNIDKTHIARLISKGLIERVKRGVYVFKSTWGDEYFNLIYGINGVYSYDTALYFLGLCESVPIKYNITVPRGYNGSLNHNNKVILHFSKKELFEIGKVIIKSPQGQMITCYNVERTICDLLKDKNNQDIETLKYAISEYLKNKNDRNLPKLMEYAKIFNVEETLNIYLEVLM